MARAEETPRLSKQERRERAREEARRIREEQARREKRNRRLMIGGTLALMAIMAVVVTLVVINSGKSPLEGVAAPEGSDEHGGISASTSLSVEPGEGEPVRVDVYSDYTCSWCEVFEQLHAQQIVELSESGQAEFWIHPVATLDGTGDFSGYSGLAVNASATVAQHAPEQWLDFHAALFTPYSDAVQLAKTEENVPAPGLPEIEAAAASVGVPVDVIARFAEGEFREWTEATTRDFVRLRDQPATPEIQVNGELLADWTAENALRDAIAAAE